MRPFISVITALAVNLHLVLGCCAHHAHGHDGSECSGHDRGARKHACSHHHDEGDVSTPTEPAAPLFPPHDDCHESHCAFMIAGAVAFTLELTVAPAAIEVEPSAGALVLLRGAAPRDRGDPYELAVRPHLWHQVFLN
jgi:hypothetical protein